MDAIIIRRYQPLQTLGYMMLFDGDRIAYECKTMELPWRNNERGISCIPEGEYEVVRHTSPMFGECFWIPIVHGRSEILIHVGNTNFQTLGCILPGKYFGNVNSDTLLDVTYSRSTMNVLLRMLPDQFKLKIVSI